jgi:diguanylate cyclase (GGDEF)-like protein/PAS domain S-box-containing protein
MNPVTLPKPDADEGRIRVLLVEDSATDAMVIRAHLERAAPARAEVLHADTLALALVLARSNDVHLTLLDLNLPDSRGLATLERMRSASRGPIVVITSSDEPDLVAKALERRAYEVLHKTELTSERFARLLRLATLQEDTQRRLGAMEDRYRATFEHAPVGIALRALDGRWLWANRKLCEILGYTHEELYALTSVEITPPEERDVAAAHNERMARGELANYAREKRYLRKDGSAVWVDVTVSALNGPDGKPQQLVTVIEDISLRKQAERKAEVHAERQQRIAQLGQFALACQHVEDLVQEAVRVLRGGEADVAALFERLPNAEFLLHAASGEGTAESVGHSAPMPAASVLHGVLGGTAALRTPGDSLHGGPRDCPWCAWLARVRSAICVPVSDNGHAYSVLVLGSTREEAFDADDVRFAETIGHVLSTALRRQRVEQQLSYLAQFDTLTGLPNRNLLQDRLQQTVAQARRRNRHTGVLFVDLDRFKRVNDTLGHHAGDLLIVEVARRLQKCVRAGDTVGRISGDEFAIVLADLDQADNAARVAGKVLQVLARPFDIEGTEIFASASIGISTFPSDGEHAETLLRNADMAMVRAKKTTRNAYCYFTPSMNQRAAVRLQLDTDLRRAVERREFALHYQPKVDLATGSLAGMEALLRWNHPERGLVSPAEFIPALEDSGLIIPVGEWVLEEACGQIRRWQEAGLDPVPVAINLSARQFRRPDLDRAIERVLAAAGVPSSLIELEITESSLMENPEEAVRQLDHLRAAGLKISVDDFGTGYSSLSYLTRLPLSALKIDRSFVRDAGASAEASSIVRAVIDMAHNLRFTVVAEGVESEGHAAFLRRHGCDQAQGYYYGRPLPPSEMEWRLARARLSSDRARGA